jgi:hypothetical protein
MSFMNLPLLTCIDEISPRPILLIAGENAHSRYFSEDAYRAAAQPKELIIKNADHVDLYDRKDKIPLDTITEFFGRAARKRNERGYPPPWPRAGPQIGRPNCCWTARNGGRRS